MKHCRETASDKRDLPPIVPFSKRLSVRLYEEVYKGFINGVLREIASRWAREIVRFDEISSVKLSWKRNVNKY